MYLLKNLYVEHLSSEYIKSVLDNALNNNVISFYAFICHNKDINSNGQMKKPHYHLIIEWIYTKSHHINIDIVDYFKDKLYINNLNQAQCESCRSINKSIRYLTHKDNLEKTIYDDSDIVTSDFDYYFSLCEKQIKRSDTDLVVEAYLNWLESLNKIPNQLEILIWWRTYGKMNYYLSHKKNIEEISKLILS